MISCSPLTVLATREWQARAATHRTRAEQHTLPARRRREAGLPHPVADFLFQYYPYPFALLERWQPGCGVALEWIATADSPAPPAPFTERCYAVVNRCLFADAGRLSEAERTRLKWIRELLEATRARPPNFACHGLHEWAMVYRGKEVRHKKTTPLRLPQEAIDTLVESRAISCSHHDAFRFFATEARPLNRLQPSLADRIAMEQPGCVHANMDLYKWAAKSMPWVGSDLLLDCFELATELRDLDMRASPYDLTAWGCEPIRIETAVGRREYETEQRRLASAAAALRSRLIDALARVENLRVDE